MSGYKMTGIFWAPRARHDFTCVFVSVSRLSRPCILEAKLLSAWVPGWGDAGRAVVAVCWHLGAVLCEGRHPAEHCVLVENGHSLRVVWSRLLTTGIWLCAGLPQLLEPSVHVLGMPGWDQPWAVGSGISRHPLLLSHLPFACVPVCMPVTTWPFQQAGVPESVPCPALPALSAVLVLMQAVPGAGHKVSTCSPAPGLVSSCWPPACEHRAGLSLTSWQL